MTDGFGGGFPGDQMSATVDQIVLESKQLFFKPLLLFKHLQPVWLVLD